ncbi:MAG: right-handed parallel beta-helix repeat-containing protein [Verrucomicrobiales bacterium]|nr:right-handed parallel beta-helix repeat-containing protein [Verrucomicrobiales bacterium]
MNTARSLLTLGLSATCLGTAFAGSPSVALHVRLTAPGAAIELSWDASASRMVLESADRLGGAWSLLDLEGVASATGAMVSVTDPRPVVGSRFYRLRETSVVPTTGSPAYDIGNPVWTDVFVDPVNGRDGDENYDGTTRARAFQTLSVAWRSMPEGVQARATRFRLLPGTYVGAYLEDRQGTAAFPILIEPAEGPGTVVFRPTPAGDSGSLQFFNCAYAYVQDFRISVEGGDALHWERCDHVLARRMQVNSRRSEGQDETVKVNQSHHVYLEDSEISDAGDNCIDVVGAQHGHIVRCRIANANDWGAYLKGGSAYWLVEGNEIVGCGTGGFTAGQGSGFQFMSPPWIHYEAYDIKVVNNLIRDCEGAGLGVNGGYNILMAYNTLYRIGARSHTVEFVHGRRGCDGGDVAGCQPLVDAGGWGTTGEELQYIPNRNVQFVNNLVYNPPGSRSQYQHFQFSSAVTPPSGSNVQDPARSDEGLVIRGNVIFDGPADWPLGNEEEGSGCRGAGCNPEQLRAENAINAEEPVLVNPAAGDFRPVNGGWLAQQRTTPAADFTWADAPSRPAVPEGTLGNQVPRAFGGGLRPAGSAPGAFLVAAP